MSNNASDSRRKLGDPNDQKFEPVLVFCRIRPLQSPCDNSNVLIKDQKTVTLVLPTTANASGAKQCLDQETNYIFKQVFGPTCTQCEVYKTVAEPLVEKLIRGDSSLLFTYGVTGSGKTYTMTGDCKELGLMPRCLKALFHSIEGFHAKKFIFQPNNLNGFEIVSDTEALARQKVERHQRGIVVHQGSTQRSRTSDLEYKLRTLVDTPPVPGVDERNVYAVFISYTEVYNNCVYDLLEECSVQRCLTSHIIREDSNHNMYVHGVSEIEIKSVQEAMEAFQMGQRNKRIGHNGLNAESSRSHSVFNIRLVQAPVGEHARENRQIIRVSQLSLVDLAGSERSCRTNNTGARLREAGNINNSLMTLRSCFEYLRENQQSTAGVPLKKIPYRDSKITLLFKNFFEGDGQVSMIACINPGLEDYTENSQVMKFAEVTQEVQISRSSVIHLSTNENEIMNVLRTKFCGYELEVPPGDGHLSEKLIYMFQKYLSKSKKESIKQESQAGKYQQRIKELEEQNQELILMLDVERMHCMELSEKNKLLESTVNENKESLAILNQRIAFQSARLDAVEQSLKNALTTRETFEINEVSHRKIHNARTLEELLESAPRSHPQTINFELIHRFIELIERDEIDIMGW